MEVAEVKNKLSSFAKKRNEFKGRLREAGTEFCCRLILLHTMSVKQASMDRVLRSDIGQLVSIFDAFVNRLGGGLKDLFRICLEKAYSDNLAAFPAALTHVSGSGTTSVS